MRRIAPISTVLASLLVSASAFANGGDTCTSPPTLILSLPYTDTGTTVGANSTISTVPDTCNGNYTFVDGPDVIYQLTLSAGNNLTVTVTPDPSWDPSIFAVSTCADGNTCAPGHGADDFLAGAAESFTLNDVTPGTYFIYVDSFYLPSDPLSAGPFTISVTGSLGTQPPQAPVASNGSLTTAEDTPGTTTLVATDPNVGDVLTYQIASQPPAGQGNVTLAGNQATYTPTANFNGPTSFTFTATDPGNLVSNTATVTVNVTPVNDAPVAADEGASTMERMAVAVTLMATDVDVGDTLTYEIAAPPPMTEGTVMLAGDQATFVPAVDFSGQTSFTFRALDSTMTPSNVATVTIMVGAINDPPTFIAPTPTTTLTVQAGQSLDFTVAASDPDSVPTYDVMSKPAAATFDMMTGVFSWATSAADVGMYPVVLQATDGISTVTRDITLEVTSVSGAGGAGGAGGGATGGGGPGGGGPGGGGPGGGGPGGGGGTGAGGTGAGGTGGTGTGGTGGAGATGSGGAGAASSSVTSGPGSGAGGDAGAGGGAAPGEEGGCGCVAVGAERSVTPSAILFGLLALIGLRRRRDE